MNLGLAIFLSAIFLGSIWLYYITKDRWNWKKIWRKTVKYLGLIILLIAIITGIVQLVKYIQSKDSSPEELSGRRGRFEEFLEKEKGEAFIPTKAEMFWDVSLGTYKKDVIFYRGKPTVKKNKNLWLYTWGRKKINSRDIGYYNVKTYLYFSNNKVTAVLKFYKGWVTGAKLNNISWYNISRSSSEGIFQYLGKPEKTINYNKDLNRIYFYPKYNCVFLLKANSVYGYGMYDSNYQEFLEKELVKY